MLLSGLPEHRLVEFGDLWRAMDTTCREGALSSRARRQCLAALQTRMLVLKCSLGLYLSQTSLAAIDREMARRSLPFTPLQQARRAQPKAA